MKIGNQESGFTLIELVVTIALVAIIATYAMPAFQNTVARSRVTSNTNLFVGAINFAKSEAIERQGVVTFRRGVDNFEWEVVVDAGLPGEAQLKYFQLSEDAITITPSNNFVAYSASGFREFGLAPRGVSDFLIENVALNIQRRVCVSIGGSVTITEGAAC